MFCVFDTETTGLPDFKLAADHPDQPRMAQLSAGLFEFDPAGELDQRDGFTHLIKPDGWEMPDELVEKLGHGFTTAHLEEHGVPVMAALEDFMKLHDESDLLVGYGIHFDLKILRGELRRVGMPDNYGEREKFDVMAKCKPLCELPPSEKMRARNMKGFKTPSLIEATDILLQKKLEGAHDAEVDMRATAELYAHLRNAAIAADGELL